MVLSSVATVLILYVIYIYIYIYIYIFGDPYSYHFKLKKGSGKAWYVIPGLHFVPHLDLSCSVL